MPSINNRAVPIRNNRAWLLFGEIVRDIREPILSGLLSVLPLKADIDERDQQVRYVPKADILCCGRNYRYSISSSGASSDGRSIWRQLIKYLRFPTLPWL
jgi:hypothetical protein